MGSSGVARADEGDQPVVRLSVAAVARRLGVAPSTLRTWDRRYGLGPSSHQAGSHRRYTPEDLDRLAVMRGLTLEGVPPAEAARLAISAPTGHASRASRTTSSGPGRARPALPPAATAGPRVPPGTVVLPIADPPPRRRTVPAASAVPLTAGSPEPLTAGSPEPLTARPPEPLTARPPGPSSAGSSTVQERAVHPGPPVPVARGGPGPLMHAPRPQPSPARATDGRCGGGKVFALPDAPQARGLGRAAMALDSHEMNRILREAIAASGVVATWDRLALPVLQAVGERWSSTGQGVDVEHLFSQALEDVFRVVVATRNPGRRPNPVLLGCVGEEFHTLPLHALAAGLAERGVACRLLGAGMPPAALVTAVRRTGPALVFLYAQLGVQDPSVLATLPRQRPAPRLVIGGPGWAEHCLPVAARPVCSLAEAVECVVALVRA